MGWDGAQGGDGASAMNPGRHCGGLRVVPYRPAWAAAYAREAARLLDATRPWITSAEHIGSTAVAGLSAKPIIDIMLAAPDLQAATEHCAGPLATAGYTYIEAYNAVMPDRRFFLRDDGAKQRTHHLHVVCPDGPFWVRHLLFRDYLRAHPDAASAYGALKERLAPRFADANAYGAAKAPFIADCLAKAEAWDARGRVTAAP